MTAEVVRPPNLKACCHKEGTNDDAVQRLWDLMESGLTQWEASLEVWGGREVPLR